MHGLTTGGTNALYGVFALPLSEAFDLSRAAVLGATASVAMISSGLLSPFAGLWLSRYSPKKIILLGCLMLSGGYFAMTLVTTWWQMSIVYAVSWSMGNVLFGALAANTSVSNWFEAERGKALGIASIGMSFGSFSFPPIITWIIVNHGWRSAYAVLGCITLAAVPFILRWYRDRPDNADGTPQVRPPGGNHWKEILGSRDFWVIGLCISICFAGFNGVTINIIPMAVDRGFTPTSAAWLLSVAAAFGVVGKIVIGMSADKLGPRKALMIPLGLLVIACLLLRGNTPYWQMMVAAAFVGLSSGGAIPVWGALIGSYFGQQKFSQVMGMMNPLLVPLIVACAPFISWVKESTGSYNPALMAIIGFIAAAFALIPLLRPLKANN
nr:MFS transporter [Litorivivens lipolytica]